MVKFIAILLICSTAQASYLFKSFTELHDKEQHVFNSSGTATAVNLKDYNYNGNYILTCAHVVAFENNQILVGEDWVDCDLIKIDQEFDVALLKINKNVLLDKFDLKIKMPKVKDITIPSFPLRVYKEFKLENIQTPATLNYLCGIKNDKIEFGASGSPLICDHDMFGILTGFTKDDARIGVYLPAKRIIQFLLWEEK